MSNTPRALILAAAKQLAETGVPDPTVDASLLLSHLTGKSPLSLRLDTDTHLSKEMEIAYQTLIEKRAERIPLQWLTGTQSFCGHEFLVTPDVLIPRPETALLAERAIELSANKPDFFILDLCCGSGCIAITCALELPGVNVTATDLSDAALAVARKNAEKHGVQVRFVQGDLFEAVNGERYNVIVSNPPYIPTEVCSELQEEVRQEPLMALDGGLDGLDFYRRIAKEAGDHLKPGGVLLLEIGIDESAEVTELLKLNGFTDIKITDDMAGIPRMVEGHWHE